MRVLRPQSLGEALAALAAHPALTPIAGGTDLFVSWPSRPHEGVSFLDLSLLKGLRPFELTPTHLEMGALTTYWDVISSPEISREFPMLVQAARLVGAVQIQTRGTWAGNVANASPAADGVPVLMAYDASVVLSSASGDAVEVPLDSFYTGYRKSRRRPDQLITRIRIPRQTRAGEYFHKVGARAAQAITKVGVAMLRDATGWRVVANSVAPTVLRCRAVEGAMNEGRRFGSPEELVSVLGKDVAPIDDIRSTGTYRMTVLSRLLYFRLQELGVGKK